MAPSAEARALYRAEVFVPSASKLFGWLAVLAFMAAAWPLVMAFARVRVTASTGGACAIAALVLGIAAWRTRSSARHEVQLVREGDALRLTVVGGAVNLDVVGALTGDAFLEHRVANVRGRQMAFPVHTVVVSHRGAPALVVQEPVGTIASHAGWPALERHGPALDGVPLLQKLGVSIHLEGLRDALPATREASGPVPQR